MSPAHPRGSSPRRADGLVRLMLERELEALATTRPRDDGLRLRILWRMADRVLAGP